MATVAETELEQKTSEYIAFVKDFAAKIDGDFIRRSEKVGFTFYIIDGDVTVEFSL